MKRLIGCIAAALSLALLAGTAPSRAAETLYVTVKAPAGPVGGVTTGGRLQLQGRALRRPAGRRPALAAAAAAGPWTGVRLGRRLGAACMQAYTPRTDRRRPVADERGLPDAQRLARRPRPGRRKLPVMVWIHGGGFVNGSGRRPLYDGAALRRATGVVLVDHQLPPGPLRLLRPSGADRDRRGAPLANYGLMDQIAALKWVQRQHRGVRRRSAERHRLRRERRRRSRSTT